MKLLARVLILAVFVILQGVSVHAGESNNPTMAMLGFKASGVETDTAEAVTRFIRSSLADTGAYSILDEPAMKKILAEKGLGVSDCTEAECAVAAGKALGVAGVMVGSVIELQGRYYIDTKVVNVGSGEVEVSLRLGCDSVRKLEDVGFAVVSSLVNLHAKKVHSLKKKKITRFIMPSIAAVGGIAVGALGISLVLDGANEPVLSGSMLRRTIGGAIVIAFGVLTTVENIEEMDRMIRTSSIGLNTDGRDKVMLVYNISWR